MLRATLAVVGLALGGITSTAAASPAPSAPPSPDGDEIIAERLAALDDAGYGNLFADSSYPGQPDGVPWPTEAWPMGAMPEGVDIVAVQDILDEAFASSPDTIDAIAIIHGGRLVLQEYGDRWDPDASHVSWSMAKSITQAMLGILVDEGAVDLWGPAPVKEWADPTDPRHAITIDEMLHMRSGLEWTEEYSGTSDVIEMLFGAGRADRAHFAASKPLESEPGRVFEYSTGTSMILSRVIADQVGYGEAGTTWAQDHLFGPLGITSVEHQLDGTGAMSGGSNINMTALDFARFGYLYLRGGEWDGTQIVPESWVDYARMPIVETPQYGAHWWVAGVDPAYIDRFPMAFYADGFNGQLTYVVPELDLVIVVLANDPTDLPSRTANGLLEAFAGVAEPG